MNGCFSKVSAAAAVPVEWCTTELGIRPLLKTRPLSDWCSLTKYSCKKCSFMVCKRFAVADRLRNIRAVPVYFFTAISFTFLIMLSAFRTGPKVCRSPFIYKSKWFSHRGFANSIKDMEWPTSRVRSEFVDYFQKQHGHVHYPSSPCVPQNDPTLLFANAGMNQFKPIFMGTATPGTHLASLRRAVNSQKCIRAGGKHNDLDDVGKDSYHHTFFEMLGTWSFGDYFKKESIIMAYDLLVNVYGLDPNRLYASYFAGDSSMGLECDEEARRVWLSLLPPERVLPFGAKENFWEMGDTGPCGPCSEIHYDRIGQGRNAAKLVNQDDPDVIEIWNHVFIQYNRASNGKLTTLPNKHIDTGMGLERLASILQDKRSNYDTDAFSPLFEAIRSRFHCTPYGGKLGPEDALQNNRDTAYRIIADHIRTVCFAVADGAVPSNEGRGYVVRRVIRRALRYGQQNLALDAAASVSTTPTYSFSSKSRNDRGASHSPQQQHTHFLSDLVPVVCAMQAEVYPELLLNQELIISTIREEEASFSTLLTKGIKYIGALSSEMKARGETIMSGADAFFMYDTLGFPIDLTLNMAEEAGLLVDMKGFEREMVAQRERSKIDAISKKYGVSGEGGGCGINNVLATPDGQTALSSALQIAGVPATVDELKYDTVKVGEGLDCHLLAVIDLSSGAVVSSVIDQQQATSSVDVTKMLLQQHHHHDHRPNNSVSISGKQDTGGGPVPLFGIVLDSTTFYAEAGGQVSDIGSIHLSLPTMTNTIVSSSSELSSDNKLVSLHVHDVQKLGQHVIHVCSVKDKEEEEEVADGLHAWSHSGDSASIDTPSSSLSPFTSTSNNAASARIQAKAQVDASYRAQVTPNHSVTHMLNKVLRDVLKSDSIEQKGSHVSSSRLRFDFTHNKALTLQQLCEVEAQLNSVIKQALPVSSELMPLSSAINIPNVRTLVNEAYPDPVRVVTMGTNDNTTTTGTTCSSEKSSSSSNSSYWQSVEFCGGTHLSNTREAENFVILEESAVAKGQRRLVAATGAQARNAIKLSGIFTKEVDALEARCSDLMFRIHSAANANANANGVIKSNSNSNCDGSDDFIMPYLPEIDNLATALLEAKLSLTGNAGNIVSPSSSPPSSSSKNNKGTSETSLSLASHTAKIIQRQRLENISKQVVASRKAADAVVSRRLKSIVDSAVRTDFDTKKASTATTYDENNIAIGDAAAATAITTNRVSTVVVLVDDGSNVFSESISSTDSIDAKSGSIIHSFLDAGSVSVDAKLVKNALNEYLNGGDNKYSRTEGGNKNAVVDALLLIICKVRYSNSNSGGHDNDTAILSAISTTTTGNRGTSSMSGASKEFDITAYAAVPSTDSIPVGAKRKVTTTTTTAVATPTYNNNNNSSAPLSANELVTEIMRPFGGSGGGTAALAQSTIRIATGGREGGVTESEAGNRGDGDIISVLRSITEQAQRLYN